MIRRAIFALIIVLACDFGVGLHGGSPEANEAFFETKVRPALIKYCYECHSSSAKKLGGNLRLDTRDGMLAGGESGPVLAPGNPTASLLVRALRYDTIEMPPDQPLPSRSLTTL